jgi:hypothetical protein
MAGFISKFLTQFTQTAPLQIIRQDECQEEQTDRIIMRDWEEAILFEAMLQKRAFEERVMFGPDGVPGVHQKDPAGWAAQTASKITPAEMRGQLLKDDFRTETV